MRSISAVIALLVAISGCRGDLPVAPKAIPDRPCRPEPNYASNAGRSDLMLAPPMLRWPRFPVLVAFDSATLSQVGDRAAWEAGILVGLQAWDVATKGAIGTITFVSDPAAADIVVRLSPFDVGSDCYFLNCLGEVYYESDSLYLRRAHIILYPEGYPIGATWSREKVAQVTAHEMGHALGVLFHSDDVADLMTRSVLPQPAPDRYPWITPSDLNTMTIAYCLAEAR